MVSFRALWWLVVLSFVALGCPTDEILDVTPPDDGDHGAERGLPPPQGCYTLAPTLGQIAVLDVDMATGEWVEVGRWGEWIDISYEADGFVVFNDRVVSVNYGPRSWMEVDTLTDAVQWGGNKEDRRGLLATEGVDLITNCEIEIEGKDDWSHHLERGLCRYPTFDELVDDHPAVFHGNEDLGNQTGGMSVTDDILYRSVWNSTSIERWDLTTMLILGAVQLLDWQDRVSAMDASGGRIYVMYTRYDDPPHLGTFDAETGELLTESLLDLADYEYGHHASGLWCEEDGS